MMAETTSTRLARSQPTSTSQLASPIDWTEEWERHRGWLRKVLRCRISDEGAVEDCLQEIALAIVQQDNKPVQSDKVPGWLYRLAVRNSIDHHRRNGRQRRLLNGFAAQASRTNSNSNSASVEDDPLSWVLHYEQRAEVARALQQLRPQDREMLMLKYTENWSYRQLARHLDCSLHTVEYRLIRAKRRLRELLREPGAAI